MDGWENKISTSLHANITRIRITEVPAVDVVTPLSPHLVQFDGVVQQQKRAPGTGSKEVEYINNMVG